MMKKGGTEKRQRSKSKDPNKRPAKRTKTLKNLESLFDTLHDELIINILVQIPVKYFPDLVRTCRRWTQLSKKQDFWRLYAIAQWGANIIPNQLTKNSTGSVEVDLSRHLIPIIQIGEQQVVDWFRYCKIRILFARVKQALKKNRRANEIEDEMADFFQNPYDDMDYPDLQEYDYNDLEEYSLEDYMANIVSRSEEDLQEMQSYLMHPDSEDEYEEDLLQEAEGLYKKQDENKNNELNNNTNNNTNQNRESLSDGSDLSELAEILDGEDMEDDDDEEDSYNDYDDESDEPAQSFRDAVQELVDQHKRETDSQHENQDNYELTNENVKNFIVDLPINQSSDFSQPHYFPKALFEFLYEVLPMVFGASNLNMTSKHMCEVLKNLCGYLEENGERFAEKYYERMVFLEGKTKQMFDLFICSCKMFLQLREADEGKKNLFKKLLQTMLDIIPLLMNFDIELELKDLLRNEFTPEAAANQEEAVEHLIPEIRNALKSTRSLQDQLPKTCDMTKFRYPSREIAEKTLTTKDPIAPLITVNTKDSAVLQDILAHFIIDKFISVDDLSVKAASLALLDVVVSHTYELCSSVLPIVCEATQHAYEEISFSGFVALHKFSKNKEIVQKLTKKQVTMAIEAIVKGIVKFPASTVYLLNTLMRILKNRGEFMSDKLFEEFNEKLLHLINEQPKDFLNPIVSKDVNLFGKFHKLGFVFKERLEKYLPKYREALLNLAATKFDAAVMIANIEAHPNVIPEEHRLLQYVLLGNACLGEKFNAEAEDFVKYLLKQKKIKIPKETFNAFFGDILRRINHKDNKKLKKVMQLILDWFNPDIPAFGIRPTVERFRAIGEDYMTFKTIPYTFKQFQDAVKAFKAKKGRRSGKTMDYQSMFEYELPALKKDKSIKNNDKVRITLNDIDAPNDDDYFPEAFFFGKNSAAREIVSLGCSVAMNNLLVVMENITDQDILEVQRAFHVVLGFLREGTTLAKYFEVAMQMFDKLKSDLLIDTQKRYMQIMALAISARFEDPGKFNDDLKHVLLNIYDKIIEFYEEYLDDRYIVEYLVTFAIIYQNEFPNEKNMMVYNLLKRLIMASPKDVRSALTQCHAVGHLFAEPPNDDYKNAWFIERLHIIALIGYHFGAGYLNRISHFRAHTTEMSFEPKEMFNKCVEFYKSAKDMDPELQDYMKRFIVLYAVHSTTDVFNLCLFNSLFIDEAATAMAVVQSEKFDTGIKELNNEAKTWDNIFDV